MGGGERPFQFPWNPAEAADRENLQLKVSQNGAGHPGIRFRHIPKGDWTCLVRCESDGEGKIPFRPRDRQTAPAEPALYFLFYFLISYPHPF